MVVYCLGDIKAKREAFIAEGEKEGKLCLDNEEVLGAIRAEEGGTVFGMGENPFANMKVADFIYYDGRIKKKESKRLAKVFALKIPFNKKMSALDTVTLRAATLLARFDKAATQLYVNFDGLLPSAKQKARLARFVRSLSGYFDIYIAVSDSRFIPPYSRLRRYDERGSFCEIAPARYRIEKGRKRDFVKLSGKSGEIKVKKVTVTRY